MKGISIIIVTYIRVLTYNTKIYVAECLNSVFKQTYKDFEIIVVDNSSWDGTTEFIKENYPWVTLIENSKNEGFYFANNQGIEIAKRVYILTLESDVVLADNFLYEMKKTMEETESNVGMLNPKILKMDGKRIDSTGLVLSKFRRFFDRGKNKLDCGQYDEKKEIFGPCAAALYKREMLEEIKYDGEYFDKDFFLLVEDFDIAWRARNRRWKALFITDAICYHMRGLSKSDSKFVQYLSFRNRYLLMLKNDWIRIKDLPYLMLYDIPRLFYLLITNSSTLKVLCDIKRLRLRMLRKRKLVRDRSINFLDKKMF